jgi:hypothetical protein
MTNLSHEAIPALVEGLDAVLWLEASTQRGKAFEDAVGCDVHIAPEGLLKLRRSDNLAGVGEQKPESG